MLLVLRSTEFSVFSVVDHLLEFVIIINCLLLAYWGPPHGAQAMARPMFESSIDEDMKKFIEDARVLIDGDCLNISHIIGQGE